MGSMDISDTTVVVIIVLCAGLLYAILGTRLPDFIASLSRDRAVLIGGVARINDAARVDGFDDITRFYLGRAGR